MKAIIKKMFFTMSAIFIALAISYVLRLIFHPIFVSGNSMYPTYVSGEILKSKTDTDTIKRFDVVTADRSLFTVIKRVIGLPGETVSMKDGKVYIDGELLREDISRPKSDNAGLLENPVVLGNDEYFIMGDNRNASSDSRAFGPVKKEQIKSVITGIYYIPENKGDNK